MSQNKNIVYLLDASSYLHRAYHAIRNLSNSSGFPTNAIFGFTKMLLKLLSENKPEHLAIVFDAKGPTFRHRLYDKYKANRPPMPADLAKQVPLVKEIVDSLDIKRIERDGYEADDIIGTLARVLERDGYQVVIVTGDKDFRQLLTPSVSMWDTMKEKVTNHQDLKDICGIEPAQFEDVMALMGDSSDNIPGVRGIGEKTAAELIREYGSLEEVYAHVEEINKKKVKENLKADRDKAVLSKKLVAICQSVPLGEGETELQVGKPDGKRLSEIFRELEFRDLWERFAPRNDQGGEYRLCFSGDELAGAVEEIRKVGIVSIDTETTSQDPFAAELVGVSLSWESGKAVYIPVGHNYPGAPAQLDWADVADSLREVLEDESVRKVGQNIKYDAEVLRRHGLDIKGMHFDTMIASYVINPGLRQHGLDYLAQHYLNHRMIRFQDVVGKGPEGRNFSTVSLDDAVAYSCEDADITYQLMEILHDRLVSQEVSGLFYDLEMRLLPVLIDMEMAGIKLDLAFLEEMSSRFSGYLEELESQIYKEAGMEFNINSPQQLGYVLFEKLQLPTQRKTAKSKNYSTDVKVLRKLVAYPHRVPELVLRYRMLSKLKHTYVDALRKLADPATGRLHTSYNQTVTATGRLSSSNPNLQNIPIRGREGRQIRKAFVAEEGHWLVSADYSQIELRIFAHYSGDEGFLDAFKKGRDIHARTALEIMEHDDNTVTPEMRRIAKAINFGIIYGMGPRKLSEEVGIDQKTAKSYIEAYFKRYQGVARYREDMIREAREKGYVKTLFGRRRYLPDIRQESGMARAEAERMAINTPIQGTAADLIKKAMINIHRRFREQKFKSRMLLQVHDELVFETPEEETGAVIVAIKEEMEHVHSLRVPLEVEIGKGKNWEEAH